MADPVHIKFRACSKPSHHLDLVALLLSKRHLVCVGTDAIRQRARPGQLRISPPLTRSHRPASLVLPSLPLSLRPDKVQRNTAGQSPRQRKNINTRQVPPNSDLRVVAPRRHSKLAGGAAPSLPQPSSIGRTVKAGLSLSPAVHSPGPLFAFLLLAAVATTQPLLDTTTTLDQQVGSSVPSSQYPKDPTLPAFLALPPSPAPNLGCTTPVRCTTNPPKKRQTVSQNVQRLHLSLSALLVHRSHGHANEGPPG